MLSVTNKTIKLNIIMLMLALLNAIMLSAIMLSAIMPMVVVRHFSIVLKAIFYCHKYQMP
jgi:hypothetical protein